MKMKNTGLFLLILLLPVLAIANSNGSIPGNAEASYNICGVVIDTTTGRTLEGVTISDGGTHTAVTGVNGLYTITVDGGWSGTITASRDGYTFSPVSRTYDNVRESFNNQNYDATPITYTISGNVADIHGNPLEGAILNYDGGSASTDASGNYSFVVAWNWSGTVIPFMNGVEFTPGSRSYSNVLANAVDQDYVSRFVPSFVITASAGAGGTISPAGKISVAEDGSLSFIINAEDGYKISDVIVDGKSVGAVSSYTFKRVKRDHFIRAIFSDANMGWLKVIIVPGEAIQQGAVWRIKGTIQWLPSSAKLELPPGVYEIEFRDLPDYGSCCLEGAEVFSGKTTIVDDACYTKRDRGAKVRYFVADDYITSPVVGSHLRWYVENSEEITLSFEGDVAAVGEKTVNPSSDSDYWLLANNLNGSVAAEVKLDVASKPVIDWLTTTAGENNPVRAGEEVTLGWRVHGAESVDLLAVNSQENVSVASTHGEIKVNPDKTTLYRLIAENSAGITTAEIHAHVTEKPVIKEFYADDVNLVSLQKTTLHWLVKGADSVEIKGLAANLKAKGKKAITPSSSKTYILVAENAAGKAEKEINVNVSGIAADIAVQVEKILFEGIEVNNAYLGSQLEAVVTITNNGAADATGFDVAISDSKGELGRKENISIKSGSAKTVRINFTAMNPGDMGLKAIGDPEGVLAETIVADNVSEALLRGIRPPMPEIVLSNISFEMVEAEQGKGLIIHLDIENVGNKKAENFQIDLQVNGKPVFWEAVKSIKKGETLSYKTTAAIGNKTKIKVLFTIDRYEVLGELSRENNYWYKKFNVKELQ